jgi:indoleamine 2,3-dioxygenase
MEEMVRIWEDADKDLEGCEDLMERTIVQRETLRKEVEKYSKERGVA